MPTAAATKTSRRRRVSAQSARAMARSLLPDPRHVLGVEPDDGQRRRQWTESEQLTCTRQRDRRCRTRDQQGTSKGPDEEPGRLPDQEHSLANARWRRACTTRQVLSRDRSSIGCWRSIAASCTSERPVEPAKSKSAKGKLALCVCARCCSRQRHHGTRNTVVPQHKLDSHTHSACVIIFQQNPAFLLTPRTLEVCCIIGDSDQEAGICIISLY